MRLHLVSSSMMSEVQITGHSVISKKDGKIAIRRVEMDHKIDHPKTKETLRDPVEDEQKVYNEKSKEKKMFQCEKCDMTTNHRASLMRHKREMHGDFQCEHCNFSTDHKVEFTKHKADHKFNKGEQVDGHVQRREKKKWQCGDCDWGKVGLVIRSFLLALAVDSRT